MFLTKKSIFLKKKPCDIKVVKPKRTINNTVIEIVKPAEVVHQPQQTKNKKNKEEVNTKKND